MADSTIAQTLPSLYRINSYTSCSRPLHPSHAPFDRHVLPPMRLMASASAHPQIPCLSLGNTVNLIIYPSVHRPQSFPKHSCAWPVINEVWRGETHSKETRILRPFFRVSSSDSRIWVRNRHEAPISRYMRYVSLLPPLVVSLRGYGPPWHAHC